MPRFQDIPRFTRNCGYVISVGWGYVETQLEDWQDDLKLDLDPPFQRPHVWTREQQVAYVEHILMGGWASRLILFNCPGWAGTKYGQMVLVDGKQRLNAVRLFISNQLAIFGGNLYKDYTDSMRMSGPDFLFGVNSLDTKAEILRWYLELNTGGTPHSTEEISKVKKMLANLTENE